MGVVTNEYLAKSYAGTFTKFQDKNKGLSFGFIPASEKEFVWFMQYASTFSDVSNCSAAEIEKFCTEQLQGFPAVVSEILESNNFENSYVWNTTDFDLLPSFHSDNVVSYRDAAHLSLPFTSAGTSNGVLDARVLADCIELSATTEAAFNEYYQLRSEEVLKHITLGRELKKSFLNPRSNQDKDLRVPLINNSPRLHRHIKHLLIFYTLLTLSVPLAG
jgi:2-polyprenyl-6-methoxyphenol hydroxylase-like FAD-dependent oxidoreductase